MSAPVDYTNDVRTIAALDNFMSINNAVDLDLFGQVNAESAGIRLHQRCRRTARLRSGRLPVQGRKELHLLLLLPSRRKAGDLRVQDRSDLAHGSIVTDTRANIHYLVTEYGKVNLKVSPHGKRLKRSSP